MYKKLFTMMAVVLLAFAALPFQVFAMTDTSVELPFVVEEAPGSVIIEAIEEAPLPDVIEFKDVTEGKFVISYSEPNTYHYRVYQKAGSEEDVIYDETVYNVIVSVLVDDEGMLYSVITIGREGETEKPSEILFSNGHPTVTPPDTEVPPDKVPGGPQTSIDANRNLWISGICLAFAGLCFIGIYGMHRRKREEQ